MKSNKKSCIFTREISVSSKGFNDIIDITNAVEACVSASGFFDGMALVFVAGSTAGITTVEYESGLVSDLKEAFEKIAPMKGHYSHDARWGDGNGYAHVRASLLGPGRAFPIAQGRLTLGTWQQIVLIDFDNRPRSRKIITKVIGE